MHFGAGGGIDGLAGGCMRNGAHRGGVVDARSAWACSAVQSPKLRVRRCVVRSVLYGAARSVSKCIVGASCWAGVFLVCVAVVWADGASWCVFCLCSEASLGFFFTYAFVCLCFLACSFIFALVFVSLFVVCLRRSHLNFDVQVHRHLGALFDLIVVF